MAFEHHGGRYNHCYDAAAAAAAALEGSWSCSAISGNVLHNFGRSFSVLQGEDEVHGF